MKSAVPVKLTAAQSTQLLATLETRVARHPARHSGVTWAQVKARLETNPARLKVLAAMEATGGEPDVTGRNAKSGAVTSTDCSPQSPAGRTSLCYDRAGLESRKEHQPKNTAIDLAAELGVEVLDEAGYRALQQLGEFDTKSSSWIKTPDDIRAKGGALFCDRRYGHVFTYHNGAQSYYSGRGFRARLVV
ncbi:MAG: hypothetical protein RIS54_161 [Verrucomicrobiota bacterium]|jgi:hypothetical protein